jgi:uncharacterized membrane protein
MKSDGKFVARVAIFSALAYVLALISMYIPNVSLSFIAVFACGALFGTKTGLSAGGLGMFLWSVFNPYGMAAVPVTLAQIIGMMIVGVLGGTIASLALMRAVVPRGFWLFGIMGLITGFVYQIIVSGVNAWLFGPFWQSLEAGLAFALITIVSNAIIFPACYPVIVKLAVRGR